MPSFDEYRESLVRTLESEGVLRSDQVAKALRSVGRDEFIEFFYLPDDRGSFRNPKLVEVTRTPSHEVLQHIYDDVSLTIRVENGVPCSSSSQPSLVAEMLEALELESGHKVLEIGSGTGYNAALMAEVVGPKGLVVTMEYLEDVASQARRLLSAAGYGQVVALSGDGFGGWAERAPYDRIIATVGCSDLAPPWLQQVSEFGFLLIPLRYAGINLLVRVTVGDDRYQGRIVGFCGFMAIEGKLADPSYWPQTRNHGEAATNRPVWPDFLDESRPDDPWWHSPVISFGLFSALNRSDITITANGVELLEPQQAWAEVNLHGISGSGDERLFSELDSLHELWIAAGRPNLSDYVIEFWESEGQTSPKASKGDNWVVRRRFYLHNFSLDMGSRAGPSSRGSETSR